MIRFKIKTSSMLLILTVVVLAALVITHPKSIIAGSTQAKSVSEVRLDKGSIAPGFTLENMDGENISLKDFRGSILVLSFGFEKGPAADIEKYRSAINAYFKEKGVKFLKVIAINKPIFITKDFVRKKMKGLFNTKEPIKHTVIDWGGSLGLDKKYTIKDIDIPSFFILGREGKILFDLQGWYSEKNLNKLKKELSTILEMGENAYLGNPGATQKKIFHIGVSRLMANKYLALKQKGFEAALEQEGYVEGKNVIFDHQNAQANPNKMIEIAHKFVNDKVDLIHCLSITGSMILLKEVTDIPVLIYATGVDKKDLPTIEPSQNNLTGIAVLSCALQDRWPVEHQLEMYVKFIPNAKRWGTIYNPGSANTMFHIREIRDTSRWLGLKLVEATASSTSEIKKAAKSLVGKVDAIYITSDKIPMSAFENIAEVCKQNQIPLFGGEFDCVSKGAIAVCNINYFDVGYKVGKLAVRILNGEKPADIPIVRSKKLDLVISLKNAKNYGVTIPEELKEKADKIL